MITLLKRLFIANWQRKLISLILAMIIWMVAYHSIPVIKQPPQETSHLDLEENPPHAS